MNAADGPLLARLHFGREDAERSRCRRRPQLRDSGLDEARRLRRAAGGSYGSSGSSAGP
ncbi:MULTISPECIES: hypothetical protein [unclassified Streptomyces]|uniref:hypothetical protein n=1 Tax=unclassified Streptomyces TaxID=2593676 RepID=UPI0032486218